MKIYKLRYKLYNSWWSNEPTHHTNSLELPDYIDYIISIEPVIPIYQKIFHRLRWIMVTIFNIIVAFSKFTYIHPGQYAANEYIKFEYNTKHKTLYLINSNDYNVIEIFYTSKSKNRNDILEKLNI